MSIFYVFQGETYREERKGGYVWSPQLNKRGGKNAGYTTMTFIHKGDFIFHNSNGKIYSVSIAKNDCYKSEQPQELKEAKTTTQWNQEGYRVDLEYVDFDKPLIVTDHKDWLSTHYNAESAFQANGRGKQQYMCHLADEHAIYFLEKAIDSQTNAELKKLLSHMLEEMISDSNSEYDTLEKEQINELLEDNEDEPPEWPGIREQQALRQADNIGQDKPKRDPKRAADALKRAEYKCEYDSSDRTFLRKNGKPYTEPHHLIPISKYRDFDYSVDIMENIVSLCSYCHNLLH